MTDDARFPQFHVRVEYSSRGVEVAGRRLAETACSQTISQPHWLERMIGITFEGQVRGAIERTQRICDRLNKRCDEAQRVCEAVEENWTTE